MSLQAKRHLSFFRRATGGSGVDMGPVKVPDWDSIFVDGCESGDGMWLDVPHIRMVVGYLGCAELPAATGPTEDVVRSCLRRLWTEHTVRSLVLVEAVPAGVRVRGDSGAVLASYLAETLVFSAICPDDGRFFGLVAAPVENRPRTSCHAFAVDPELCSHKAHQDVARRFCLECTPTPVFDGCLEFPSTVQRLLQLFLLLQQDIHESVEMDQPRAFPDTHPYTDCDSGIGNLVTEDPSDRVLLVNLEGSPSRPCNSVNTVNCFGFSRKVAFNLTGTLSDGAVTKNSDRQCHLGSTDVNRREKPRPMSQSTGNLAAEEVVWKEKRAKTFFFPDRSVGELTGGKQSKCGKRKRSRFGALGVAFPFPRRSVGQPKLLSLTRSLDDLELSSTRVGSSFDCFLPPASCRPPTQPGQGPSPTSAVHRLLLLRGMVLQSPTLPLLQRTIRHSAAPSASQAMQTWR
ncbi:uncharacterized protein LOC108931103 [Scleropages formosus]|uniref:uncharacterized protein LOC108931103 n=1 Tax=Scleropages formosus TaxID=113540 RepID=UPI000878F058|nr:uncharacterized protein LOC108931103 [Scleropages formosus]